MTAERRCDLRRSDRERGERSVCCGALERRRLRAARAARGARGALRGTARAHHVQERCRALLLRRATRAAVDERAAHCATRRVAAERAPHVSILAQLRLVPPLPLLLSLSLPAFDFLQHTA